MIALGNVLLHLPYLSHLVEVVVGILYILVIIEMDMTAQIQSIIVVIHMHAVYGPLFRFHRLQKTSVFRQVQVLEGN